MTEREIIEVLARGCARSARQKNALFTSDAEILDLGGELLAITVDDYSAEDRLAAGDPALLGWNLVTATVSDLLAVGAEPRFLLNSLVVSPDMDDAYLRALSAGMREALAACGATLAGGDIGTGPDWRYTGVALGSFRAGQAPMSRIVHGGAVPRASAGGARADSASAGGTSAGAGLRAAGGAVMVTGAFGDANLAAGVGGPAPRFELRLAESAALAAPTAFTPRGTGSTLPACIDTSDGLVAALETLCKLNPGLRVEIDPAAVPYAPGVIEAAAAMHVPPEVFLMGSAGEYELLALVSDYPADAVDAAAQAGLRRIGAFSTGAMAGLYFHRETGCIALPELPDPRESGSFDAYCAGLIAMAQRAFGPGGRI